MHEYDIALKRILTREPCGLVARLTGLEVTRWHNAELPEVRSRRADLLGETRDGALVHVELQSTNDSRMAMRMLEYAVAIERGFGRFPTQLVLYVGEAPLRMGGEIEGEGLAFRCRIVDIRELDGEALLESRSLDDNIISLLARLSDELGTVRRILGNIAASDERGRAEAIAELMIVAGLRSLATVVQQEIERMPILNDIMDHEVLGPKIREALAAGRVEGERTLLVGLIRKRFGPLPEWATKRISSLGASELEEIAPRVLDARTLEEVFD